MKSRVTKITLAALALVLSAAASAAPITFKFQNTDADTLTPLGNFNAGSCINPTTAGISGADYCTDNNALGFDYEKDGVSLNVIGYTDGEASSLVQDRRPRNSGLGVLSPGERNSDDQVQLFDLRGNSVEESVLFDFDGIFELTSIDFNAGADKNCSNPGREGPCGTFDLFVDGSLFGNYAASDDLAFGGILGSDFLIVATGLGAGDTGEKAGFAIGSFTVTEVSEPGTALLLLAGLAGLGVARRRAKAA